MLGVSPQPRDVEGFQPQRSGALWLINNAEHDDEADNDEKEDDFDGMEMMEQEL